MVKNFLLGIRVHAREEVVYSEICHDDAQECKGHVDVVGEGACHIGVGGLSHAQVYHASMRRYVCDQCAHKDDDLLAVSNSKGFVVPGLIQLSELN